MPLKLVEFPDRKWVNLKHIESIRKQTINKKVFVMVLFSSGSYMSYKLPNHEEADLRIKELLKIISEDSER